MKNQIQYLQHQEIDKIKWDQCVETSSNGLIYASSIYLDHLCGTWDAIVCNNYEAVMPIPLRKKYGIYYSYQPPFIQQLGLIYKDEKYSSFLQPVLQEISGKIKFGDYPLNFLNVFTQATIKNNFILFLNRNYENLSEHYSSDLKRNLKQAEKHQLKFATSDNYDNAIQQYQLLYSSRIPHITAVHYKNLNKLIHQLFEQKKVIIREAQDEQGNVLAVNVCFNDSKRLYLLLSSTTTAGRKKEANHFLLDQMIKEFSGKNLIFDFEGSDIPGVAYFYQGFGAINQPYYFYQWNHLPLPVKMIKQIFDKIKR